MCRTNYFLNDLTNTNDLDLKNIIMDKEPC